VDICHTHLWYGQLFQQPQDISAKSAYDEESAVGSQDRSICCTVGSRILRLPHLSCYLSRRVIYQRHFPSILLPFAAGNISGIKAGLLSIGIVILLSGISTAQKISLKKGWFGESYYSIDGGNYKSIGFLAASISGAIGPDTLARRQLKSYRYNEATAVILGFSGGFMELGLFIEMAAGEGDFVWRPRSTIELVGGASLIALGFVFDSRALRHLENMVNIYNRNQNPAQIDLDIIPSGPGMFSNHKALSRVAFNLGIKLDL
jgi:hypothetical protein